MERPYVFNREGKRVIIPKVKSVQATREWLQNMIIYSQNNDIVYLVDFVEKVDSIIDEQIGIEVDRWLDEKVFNNQNIAYAL